MKTITWFNLDRQKRLQLKQNGVENKRLTIKTVVTKIRQN